MRSWLLDAKSDPALLKAWAGGKARNMAAMANLDLPVPPWFCVSAQAYAEFVRENNLGAKLDASEPFSEFAADVEAAFLQAKISSALRQEIEQKLNSLNLEGSFVAVRSSGLDEDSAEHSFAGQFSSYLFQRGWSDIETALKRCWASGYSERALSYRKSRGLPLTGIMVGVVIQKMIDSEVAGVAFSRHPIKVLDRELILISGVWGQGEGLVSGELESDNFEVDRKTMTIGREIVKKTHEFRSAARGGLEKRTLPDAKSDAPCLSDGQIAEIANLARRLEDRLQLPQDLEWVFEGGKLFVVQTRPITNLPPPAFFDPSINGGNLILWDNSNIIESYSGVTSPLTFSFASRAYHQVYVQFCELMGVPKAIVQENDGTFRNMLGLVRGRIYYNLINWYKLVLMLPGSSSNKGFMETMMGVRQKVKPEHKGIFEAVESPPSYSLGKKLVLFARTVQRFWLIESIVHEFQTHFKKIYDKARAADFTKMPLSEQLQYYFYLEDQLLKRWHAPIINDYLCMVFFGLLKKLTESWISSTDTNSSLQNDLLCGEGGLESTEPTKYLMRVAAEIDSGDPEFRAYLLAEKPDKAWSALKEGKNPKVYSMLLEFLDRYGFRCVNELKLEEPDLHDDPSFVINSVSGYIRTKSYDIHEMEARERAIRAKAEAVVTGAMTGLKLKIYFWVLKQARLAVKNRENLRFGRTKVFGISRHLFRAMGLNLKKLEVIKDPHDIFYLTVDEIVAFVEGRALSPNLGSVVASRRAEFDGYRASLDPPDRFISSGAVGVSLAYPQVIFESDLMRHEKPLSDDPNILIGTPCCPGIVEGAVRVVQNLKDAEGINNEILVTARTDPGWVPLYPACSGLLIERGSLLSHSAVVARELGIPTIVGVSGGLMTRLKTGARVRVDAGKGEIRILEDE